MSACYLDHIGSSLGASSPLAKLAAILTPQLQSDLANDGFQFFRDASQSPADLASLALQDSLDRARLSPEQLDLIVYCSVTGLSDEPSFLDTWSRRRAAFRTPIIGLGLGNCSNLSHGLRVGTALLRQEGLRQVAVVVADRVPDPRARLAPFDGAIMSDGAASLLLSDQPGDGWRILSVRHVMDHSVRLYWQAGELSRTVVQTARRVRGLVADCLADAGLEITDVQAVVGVNIRTSRISALLESAGLSAELLRNNTLGQNAHVYAADSILNLASVAAADTDRAIENVLMLNLGPSNWGASVLQRTRP